MPARKRTISMTVSLVVGFGTLVAIAVLAVLGVGIWSATLNTVSLLRDKADLTHALLTARIEGHLSPASSQVGSVARAMADGTVDPGDALALGQYLHGAMAGVPQMAALVYIDTDHQLVGAQREEGRVFVYRADYSRDAVVREATAALASASGAVWGEVVWRERYGVSLLNLRQPVRRANGDYAGMLVALVSLSDLSRFLDEMSDSLGATAFILHDRYYVLAHPALAHGHRDASADNPLPRISEISDPVLQAIWDSEGRVARRIQMREPLRNHGVEVDGSTYVFVYREERGFSDRPWIVGGYFEAAGVSQEIVRLRWAIYAGGGGFLLALGMAILLGRRIARPVVGLANSAEKIGMLEIDDVEDLPASRISELNRQSRAFNTMLRGLRWFEIYVPKTLVNRLIRSGEVASETREVTVMFTDIAGFSTLSENMTAQEVAALVNEHFGLLGAAIEAEGGTIDKYIGDAVMAFWGAPERQPDHAARACRAALAIRDAVEAENENRRARGQSPVTIRIGIHSGAVTVGNIGAPGRVNYTVIGDAVNVAQRLESLGREVYRDGTAVTIVVSETTRSGAGPGFAFEPAGARQVKGRSAPIEVYTL